MTEIKDTGEPEQELPKLSGDAQTDAKTGEEGILPLVVNPAAEDYPQAPQEASTNNISEHPGTPSKALSAQYEPNVVCTGVTLEMSDTSVDLAPPDKVIEDPGLHMVAEGSVFYNVAEGPAPNKVVEDTGLSNVAESSGSDNVVEDPALYSVAENPGSASVAVDPALNNAAGEPTSNNAVEDCVSISAAEVPAFNNAHEGSAANAIAEGEALVNQVENVSHQIGVFDDNTGMTTEMFNAQVGNKEGAEEADCKITDSEKKHLMEHATAGDSMSHEDGRSPSFIFDYTEGEESGTEDELVAFMKELETFHKEKNLEFKPPKFYGEGLNCLKLWRTVTRLGGYEQVTSCKLWRQVGESFRPPKTCTTVSWSFRIFYEKALLEYEKHKTCTGELQLPVASLPVPMALDHQVGENQSSGSGRARRDAAARAMQGWHSQRLFGSGEDKCSVSVLKQDKHLKNIGVLKRKKSFSLDRASVKVARPKLSKPESDIRVLDVGAPTDWVKINVQKTKDCFEVYALVPGLLREEVHVQSDPQGRLVISGEPEQPDNPWGVTPFKKVITLPSRIDPHQTSAVVTLHGQLFVRAPFEQSES